MIQHTVLEETGKCCSRWNVIYKVGALITSILHRFDSILGGNVVLTKSSVRCSFYKLNKTSANDPVSVLYWRLPHFLVFVLALDFLFYWYQVDVAKCRAHERKFLELVLVLFFPRMFSILHIWWTLENVDLWPFLQHCRLNCSQTVFHISAENPQLAWPC